MANSKSTYEELENRLKKIESSKDQLQIQMKNLDAVFESSPVPMFVIDYNTNILMTNLAFTLMCGGSE